jgi:hypothetical protein
MSVREHHDTRPGDRSSGSRALCGWSPSSLAADTALKRCVDLIRVGSVAAFGIVVMVVVLLNRAAHFPSVLRLSPTGLPAWSLGGGVRSISGDVGTRTASSPDRAGSHSGCLPWLKHRSTAA